MSATASHAMDAEVLSAIHSHDLQRLNEALRRAAELAMPGWKKFFDEPGFTMACQIGSVPTVELLLENGAKAYRTPCYEGPLSPLDAAANYGRPEIIKLFATKYGGDVNEHNAQGVTPLMRAVQERRIDAAQVLIDLGASLDCVSHDGVDLTQRARMKACISSPYESKPLPTE